MICRMEVLKSQLVLGRKLTNILDTILITHFQYNQIQVHVLTSYDMYDGYLLSVKIPLRTRAFTLSGCLSA